MKLVEILARQWDCWVAGLYDARQDEDGRIWQAWDYGNVVDHAFIAEDREDSIVTRAQWEAKRARIATSDAMEESKKIIESGSARFSSAEEMLCSFDAESVAEDWRNECQKQHEQELWDKVALDMYKHYRGMRDLHEDAMGYAFFDADAFMAERAKRMKG